LSSFIERRSATGAPNSVFALSRLHRRRPPQRERRGDPSCRPAAAIQAAGLPSTDVRWAAEALGSMVAISKVDCAPAPEPQHDTRRTQPRPRLKSGLRRRNLSVVNAQGRGSQPRHQTRRQLRAGPHATTSCPSEYWGARFARPGETIQKGCWSARSSRRPTRRARHRPRRLQALRPEYTGRDHVAGRSWSSS